MLRSASYTRQKGPQLVCASATALFLMLSSTAANSKKFSDFNDFASSKTSDKILWDVLARKGKSKSYQHVLPLDGGTVGIAHFAVGGLASLYKHMDTDKYFGLRKSIMIANYSSKCRPAGKTGNDRGWGCYSKHWWRRGMERFVKSPESSEVQKAAWLQQMTPTVKAAINNGWNSERSLAIATGIANSVGASGFRKLATRCGWSSEKTLRVYAKNNAHRSRRRDAINSAFPK